MRAALAARCRFPPRAGVTTALGAARSAHVRGLKVFVGISGGVDSSVAAAVVKDQGHDVVGVFMRNWDSADEAGQAVCPQDADLESAQAVAQHLGIPLVERGFEPEYWASVFEPFLSAYAEGRTPNPDVACNRHVKFGAFHDWCMRQGADMVATGHYAGLEGGPSAPCADGPSGRGASVPAAPTDGDALALRAWEDPASVEAAVAASGGRAVSLCPAPAPGPGFRALTHAADPLKDQSYFLCGVRAPVLETVALPLGAMCKGAVRTEAAARGLPTASRRDSTGICFIGKRSMRSFLPQYLQPTAGAFVDAETGREVGRHPGAELFTVGQSARVSGASSRLYVLSRDVADGTVWVVRSWDHPALFAAGLLLAGEPGLPPEAAALAADADLMPVEQIGGILPRATGAGATAGAGAGGAAPEQPLPARVGAEAARASRSAGAHPAGSAAPWDGRGFNWLLPSDWPGFAELAAGRGVRALAKLNNRMPAAAGTLWLCRGSHGRTRLGLRLDLPHRAVSAGQVAALYVPGGAGGRLVCAGGTEIEAAGPSLAELGAVGVRPGREELSKAGVSRPELGTTWQAGVETGAGTLARWSVSESLESHGWTA